MPSQDAPEGSQVPTPNNIGSSSGDNLADDICCEVKAQLSNLLSPEEFTWLNLYWRQAQVFCALLSLPNDWQRADAFNKEVWGPTDNALSEAFRQLSGLSPIEAQEARRLPPQRSAANTERSATAGPLAGAKLGNSLLPSLALGFKHTHRRAKLEALTTDQLKQVCNKIFGKRKLKSRQQIMTTSRRPRSNPTLDFLVKKGAQSVGAQPATQFDRMMLLVDELVDVYEFFRVMNVLYYRRTTYPDFSQGSSHMPTREALKLYYDALQLRARVEGRLPWPADASRQPVTKSSKPRFSAKFLKLEDTDECHTAAQVKMTLVKEAVDKVQPELERLGQAARSEDDDSCLSLRRFELGFALTRVLWTGAQVLAKSRADKDKTFAIQLYGIVVQQNRWCLGDTGAMYAEYVKLLLRCCSEALLNRQRAYDVVKTALEQQDVIERRLQRYMATLAKALKVQVAVGLGAPSGIKLESIRLVKHVAEVEDNAACHELKGKNGLMHLWNSVDTEDVPSSAVDHVQKRYTDELGYTALREKLVLTSIFALLFGDILWDRRNRLLCSRQDQICARLEEIRNGCGVGIAAARLDGGPVPVNTTGFDVSLDRDVLLHIVKVMDAAVLVTVCTLFCEDYVARRDSVPDLVAYNEEEVRLVYVTDGKVLTPAQRVWIETLLSVHANVDHCKVVNEPTSPCNIAKKRKRTTRKADVDSDEDEMDAIAYKEESEDESSFRDIADSAESGGQTSQPRRSSRPRS
ncbi:hypothetical protein BD626DRAFT_508773 [Schizophyllum amplum]|uniref:Fanconi-associated nuclease n=1 Tax=Schizophyllum amplum TaxID=97359 RepID=A0A550C396_9AGAR|nr:hypothetical protein BD626DRAFT_508773 [Auriculariopsis ampla]